MRELKFEDLPTELQKVLDPAKPQLAIMVAKGMAPLAPPLLFTAWVYLLQSSQAEVAEAARKSIEGYPEKMLLSVAQAEIPGWALAELGARHQKNENVLEAVLLNPETPSELFVELARTCSEKMTQLIANNQERILDFPEIVLSLEKNPHNLKSNTDRLRHFLSISGIAIPGDPMRVHQDEAPAAAPATSPTSSEIEAAAVAAESAAEALKDSKLSEDQRLSLLNYIQKLNVGGKIKIAMKGNKEVRQICIRDSNKIVALAVLKSPRISELEVAHYATLKSLSDDVVRVMSTNVAWTKNYSVKMNLCSHPKTPLQNSMAFLKFLTLRDLTKINRDKGIPAPLQKAAKELLALKRK